MGFDPASATGAAMKPASPAKIAEAALAHRIGNAVERAYRRRDAFEKRRQLMAAWAILLLGGRGEQGRCVWSNGASAHWLG